MIYEEHKCFERENIHIFAFKVFSNKIINYL